MAWLPIFLKVQGWQVLIVGGGSVGRRKAATLHEHGAEVMVVDPEAVELPEGVRQLRGKFRPTQLEGMRLAFACTADPAVNDDVCKAAKERGILCNRVDAGEGDFTTPPHRSDGEVTIVASAGSPALSKRLLDDLQPDPRVVALAAIMQELRPWIREQVPAERRPQVFRRLTQDDALDAATQGLDAVRALIDEA